MQPRSGHRHRESSAQEQFLIPQFLKLSFTELCSPQRSSSPGSPFPKCRLLRAVARAKEVQTERMVSRSVSCALIAEMKSHIYSGHHIRIQSTPRSGEASSSLEVPQVGRSSVGSWVLIVISAVFPSSSCSRSVSSHQTLNAQGVGSNSTPTRLLEEQRRESQQ